MASKPVSTLLPRPGLRENDLAALRQAGKKPEVGETGEVDEDEYEPGSTLYTGPSSSSSTLSSTS